MIPHFMRRYMQVRILKKLDNSRSVVFDRKNAIFKFLRPQTGVGNLLRITDVWQLLEVAPLTKYSFPELHSNNSKYKEHKKTEK